MLNAGYDRQIELGKSLNRDFSNWYINLEELAEQRKKNETPEHFVLKFAGMFYLYEQMCRPVGLEIELPHRNNKKIVDVVGLAVKGTTDTKEYAEALKEVKLAEELIAEKADNPNIDTFEEIMEENEFTYISNKYHLMNLHNDAKRYDRYLGNKLRRKRDVIYGIEVKTSKADFKNGFNDFADYTYILAPEGVLEKAEIPKYIGLLEADFERLAIGLRKRPSVSGIRVTKKASFNRDEYLLYEDSKTDLHKVAMIVNGILRNIAMDNWFRSLKLLTYGGLTQEE